MCEKACVKRPCSLARTPVTSFGVPSRSCRTQLLLLSQHSSATFKGPSQTLNFQFQLPSETVQPLRKNFQNPAARPRMHLSSCSSTLSENLLFSPFILCSDGLGSQRLAERPAGEVEQRAGRAQHHVWEQVDTHTHAETHSCTTSAKPPAFTAASRLVSESARVRWRLCCTRSRVRSTTAPRTRWRPTPTTCCGPSWTFWMGSE